MSDSKTIFEYAEYVNIYQEIVEYVTKEHKTWTISKPELPSFFEMAETKKEVKMVPYTESKLTEEESKTIIEQVIRKMYSTTELATYEVYKEKLFEFIEVVVKKFPALAEEVPSETSIVDFTEVYSVATDKKITKPTPPTEAEIKKMTEKQAMDKISELTQTIVTAKKVVVYEIIANTVEKFVEDVKKAHTDFKIEAPEFPSYISVSDEVVAAKEILESVKTVKKKEEAVEVIEKIKTQTYGASNPVVYEIYSKLAKDYVEAVNKAHTDYKIEEVKVIDYQQVLTESKKVEAELKESKSIDVSSTEEVKKLDEKKINETI